MSGQGNGKQSTYIYVGRVNVVRAGDSIHLAQNHSGMVIWESKQPMVLEQGATGARGVFYPSVSYWKDITRSSLEVRVGCPCLAEPCLSHLGLSQGREEERWPHDHTGRTAGSKVAMFSRWVQTLTTAGVHSASSGRRTRSFHSGFPEDTGVTGLGL